jgi:hypothetical protein
MNRRQCARCGDEYNLRDGMEETKYCDPCAQECVSELEPMVKKLRDFIEFGPVCSTEATNLVLEADAVLRDSCI